MAIGDIISAANYNALQSRINTVMGTGSGSTGYGQSLISSQVSVGGTVTLAHVLNLRSDMIKARRHQVLSGSDTELASETTLFPVYTSVDTIDWADITNFQTRMTEIETDKLVIGGNQGDVGTAISSARTAAWTSTITHQVTVDFGSANAARYFFNSGGELRTYATISGYSGSIGTDWNTILTNMGTIKMNYTQTTSTGTGTGSNIGFYDLTSTDQQIFTKTGTAYAVNDYTVYARCDVANNSSGTARYVYLTIKFNDDKGPNPTFDESPGGTTTSYVNSFRATGSNVAVSEPTLTTTANL